MSNVVWTVKGGRNGEREDRLIQQNLIGGGWEQLPSLEDISSKEELAGRYRTAYPDAKASTVANYVGQLWSLLSRMQEGELVVLSLKTTGTVAVGRIAGPYQYRDDLETTYATAGRSAGWPPTSPVTRSIRTCCIRSAPS
jgi:restriction system protein